ncbi:MAG: hypothetical protein QOF26_3667 [Baekduia sp.]|jgi:uncharacterized protein YkwD|nr:hypothetical protein [Baekduia sp.]
MSLRRRAAAVAAVSGLAACSTAVAAPHAAAPARSAAAACRSADQTTTNATVSELASGVRCLLNQQRAGHGAPATSANRRLAVAARGHAADMVARHYFAHTSLGGATFVDRIRRTGYVPSQGPWAVGEILAWASGTQATPRGIVDAWMASPEHRQILLDPKFSEVGVGVTVGAPRADQSPALTVAADFGKVG